MSKPLPTFVVGVGQAGIEILKSLADTVDRNDSNEYFNFAAVDTEGDTLGSVPEGTKRIRLKASSAHEREDKATYPYLSDETEIGSKGAERQRPVGRYKLDSRGHRTFDDYFSELWNEVRDHHDTVDYTFRQDRDSYNIILLHSLGGGTGSGTFPLLAAMLNKIGQRLDDRANNTDVYLGAVGVVPMVNFDPDFRDPPGESMYYPNTFASLNDMSKLIEADSGPIDIPLYSKSFSQGGRLSDVEDRVQESFSGNGIPIQRSPFNDHWLVGVNEDLMSGGRESEFVEDYTEQIDRRVAEAIYALSEMEQSVENWSSRAKGESPLGTIGHAQIKVPHEQVKEFCKMKDERAEKQTLVNETIPNQLEDLRTEKDRLESIKQDPTSVEEHLDDAPDWRQSLTSRFEANLGAGNALINESTATDIDEILDAVEEEVGPEMSDDPSAEPREDPDNLEEVQEDRRPELLLLATDILGEMLDHPNAAPSVEDYWEEVVSNQWETYDMADRTKYGGAATTTLKGKVDALESFYDEKITEFERQLESVELGTFGEVQDMLPPFHPLLESEREEAERKLNTVRDSRDDLAEADGKYDRVQAMREAVQSRRKRAKNLLDGKLNDVNELITTRENEKQAAQERIDTLARSIEREKDVLSQSRTGKRLGVFPLRRDKLDELTLSRAEQELTSLDQYIAQDFIDERKVREGINEWVEQATSWAEPVVEMDFSGTDKNEVSGRQEMWLLYHEDNETYAREGADKMMAGTERQSGSDDQIDYINDPYSILFTSYYNRGPVEALTTYQRLDEMAEQGKLDAMAGKYKDYRQSFAYPEWYPREIQLAHQIEKRQTIGKPPKLDIEKVVKPEMSEGEKKNQIKQTGLDNYLWQGTMWDDYAFEKDDEVFDGWQRTLEGVTWTDIQEATPDADLKSRWIAGQADWEDILEAYKTNLEDNKSLQLVFEGEAE